MKKYFSYLVVEIWAINYNEDSISNKFRKKSVTNRKSSYKTLNSYNWTPRDNISKQVCIFHDHVRIVEQASKSEFCFLPLLRLYNPAEPVAEKSVIL